MDAIDETTAARVVVLVGLTLAATLVTIDMVRGGLRAYGPIWRPKPARDPRRFTDLAATLFVAVLAVVMALGAISYGSGGDVVTATRINRAITAVLGVATIVGLVLWWLGRRERRRWRAERRR